MDGQRVWRLKGKQEIGIHLMHHFEFFSISDRPVAFRLLPCLGISNDELYSLIGLYTSCQDIWKEWKVTSDSRSTNESWIFLHRGPS